MSTTYLITGASRGLGRGFVEVYLSRPNTTIIAAVRDPAASKSESLKYLPTGSGSKIHLVKLDSALKDDAATAVETIRSLGVSQLDVVIANAGISNDNSTVATVSSSVLIEHINVNSLAVVYLFQAVLPLLVKGSKFVAMGSALGSIGGIEQRPFPSAAYGPSKALVHWYLRKIHQENEHLIAFPLDPGFPRTEMGNAGARFFGMEEAWQTVEESVSGCVNAIDGSTREMTGGKFASYNGEVFPW